MQGSVLSLLAAVLLLGSATAQDLKINVTLPVKCDKKTKTGDLIHVNYNGTLTDGTLFDSSACFVVDC